MPFICTVAFAPGVRRLSRRIPKPDLFMYTMCAPVRIANKTREHRLAVNPNCGPLRFALLSHRDSDFVCCWERGGRREHSTTRCSTLCFSQRPPSNMKYTLVARLMHPLVVGLR